MVQQTNGPGLSQIVSSVPINSPTQARAGSEPSKPAVAQAVNHLASDLVAPLGIAKSNTPSPSVSPLLELATGGAAPVVNEVFKYLSLDQAKQAALTCKALSKPELRHGPHTFAPPLALIEKLIAQPQTWDRVVPGFTQLKLPPGITNEQLRSLFDSRHLNAVTKLDLSDSSVTDAGLAHLPKSVTQLKLPRGITNEQLRSLVDSGYLDAVTKLDLSECNELTNAVLAHLAKLNSDVIVQPRIWGLSVITHFAWPVGARQITAAGLADLGRWGLPMLTHLDLTGLPQITAAGLADFGRQHTLVEI